jgi:hypothetical protein
MADNQDLEMLEEYDFSQGVRGKYAERHREGTNVVTLDKDVSAMFPEPSQLMTR